MKPFIIFFLISLLPAPSIARQTNNMVHVAVIDEHGKALAGAYVHLTKGGGTMVTDSKGTVALHLQVLPDTLLVTYVGYTAAKLVVARITGPLVVTLRPLQKELGEVLVQTGYQSISKERATGSFVKIDGALFDQQVGTTVLARLESIASGLSVDRKTSVGNSRTMIRGLSSFIGPREPLVVVDNFPYAGNLDNLNPNDIESITLLKDAAAASIWGARAGNGVIVITTKKGRFNQGMTMELNANIQIGARPDLYYLQNISSSDLIDVEQMLYTKGFYSSQINSANKVPLSPVVELLIRKLNGTLGALTADSAIDAYRTHDVRDDFLDLLYRPTVNQQYALRLDGGSDKVAWSLCGGYDRDISNLDAGYHRLNVRSEDRFRFTKKWQGSASFSYTDSRSVSGAPSFGEVTNTLGSIPAYTRFADSAGRAQPVGKFNRLPYLDTVGGGKLLDWNYYPLEDHLHTVSTSNIRDVLARIGMGYELVKGLTVNLQYQHEDQRTSDRQLQDVKSYYTRNLINMFSQLNRATGAVVYKVPVGGILDISERALVSRNLRGQLDYNGQWTRFKVSAIAGVETRENDYRGNAFRTYGFDADRLTYASVDLTTAYPTYIQGSTAFVPAYGGPSHTLDRYVSAYSNAAGTFLGRYIASVSARRDASNLFGANTANKWKPLWSVGGAWDISREGYYRSTWLPYLKLRATYGHSGNADPNRTGITTIGYLSTLQYTGTVYSSVNNFYNPELRWEKVGMLNIAVDFSVHADRLAGSLEYYRKKGTDLFGSSPIDLTSGLNMETLIRNVASMEGHGVDLELHSRNITGRFGWRTDVNLSWYGDKVTAYYLPSKQGSRFTNGAVSIAGVVGKPVYSVFSYKWMGLDPLTGDPRGQLKGVVSKDYAGITGSGTTVDDLVYKGPAMPTVFGSMGNTFSYRDLKITVQLTYKFGYWFQRQSISYSSLFNGYNGHTDFASRWQKPGDELVTDVPSMVYPAVSSRDAFYNGSEVLVEKGDHVRLQYVALSYDVPKGHRAMGTPSGLQLYINANNLGILWRATRSGLDPDLRTGAIPAPRNIAVGVRARF